MKYKVFFILMLSLLIGCMEVKAQDTEAVTDIESMWLEHNVQYGGTKGICIHVSFTIDNMQGRSIQVGAFFFDDEGNRVRAYNAPAQYRSRDGQLCSYSQAYVKYESTRWDDFKLFIPNGYFLDGDYECIVQISSNRGVVLAISDSESFSKNSY